MSLLLGIAVYIILWWLSFFAMLPWDAKSAHEAGVALEPGSETAAPLSNRLKFKALAAAGIAALLWLALNWALTSGWLMDMALSQVR